MNYLNTSLNWEEFFIQEAVELEETMKLLDSTELEKSKLRICFENNLLEWAQYEKWTMAELGCSSLKMTVSDEDLEKYIQSAKMTKETYSNYDFWSEDLIPLFIWDNQLIILGLQFNEKLLMIENHIFILTPPHVLSYITIRLGNEIQTQSAPEKIKNQEDSKAMTTKSILDGVNIDISAPNISFDATEMTSMFGDASLSADRTSDTVVGPLINTPGESNPSASLWDFITERHQEYSFEVKKQYGAFVILKIDQFKTKVFKMDPDLARKGISSLIFEYNLTQSNAFKKVFESGKTESFSLNQLDMNLAKYTQACITPLKRGKATVGFFIGFKNDALSQDDKNLLDDLAREVAS
jgi:hypothetical protein